MRRKAQALAVVLVMVLVGLAGDGARARDHVGSEACATCHRSLYDAWRTTSHATAAEGLPDGVARARCLTCHGTGSGLDPVARRPGVGCEACHGGGAAYAHDDIMRNPALAAALGLTARDSSTETLARTCGGCHRPEASMSSTPFDPRAAWLRIAHPRNGAP